MVVDMKEVHGRAICGIGAGGSEYGALRIASLR